ncbi:MAG: hypothetical protein EB056_06550 [Verrucomicrobia bacterium]|nr:hypothetical protein [Verrucomicrobiota bacterium]
MVFQETENHGGQILFQWILLFLGFCITQKVRVTYQAKPDEFELRPDFLRALARSDKIGLICRR